jgi:hypothetical protein
MNIKPTFSINLGQYYIGLSKLMKMCVDAKTLEDIKKIRPYSILLSRHAEQLNIDTNLANNLYNKKYNKLKLSYLRKKYKKV